MNLKNSNSNCAMLHWLNKVTSKCLYEISCDKIQNANPRAIRFTLFQMLIVAMMKQISPSISKIVVIIISPFSAIQCQDSSLTHGSSIVAVFFFIDTIPSSALFVCLQPSPAQENLSPSTAGRLLRNLLFWPVYNLTFVVMIFVSYIYY